MAQFSPPVAMRLGYSNLWQLAPNIRLYNFLNVYLTLKYFLLKKNMLLLYYKTFILNAILYIYVCYFKYKRVKKKITKASFLNLKKKKKSKKKFLVYTKIPKIKFFKLHVNLLSTLFANWKKKNDLGW